jgi:ubiquinone/menaquinone biosynthesis C-methylase UbiE
MKDTWEKFYKSRGRYYVLQHQLFDKVIQKFNRAKVHKVLDLGSGSGRHAVKLASEGFKVVGIDYSSEALSLARKWAKKEDLAITFKKQNIHKKLKFSDNSFDAIIAIDSLHYDSTESLEKTLQEMKRVLRKNGVVFLTLPTQIGNPLVTHLIFSEREIKDLVSKYFKLTASEIDTKKFLCIFAIDKT